MLDTAQDVPSSRHSPILVSSSAVAVRTHVYQHLSYAPDHQHLVLLRMFCSPSAQLRAALSRYAVHSTACVMQAAAFGPIAVLQPALGRQMQSACAASWSYIQADGLVQARSTEPIPVAI